jgi:hypothetical protein
MNNKELYKLLKKNKSNSGFTLTELLVGLFMSIFVIGALGFGLMQVLQSSKTEGSKTTARNETGRALDFISDELRRAQAIEVGMSSTYLATIDDTSTTLIDEAVAPSFNLPTGGTVRLALQIPGVDQRVIYFVAPPAANSPWKGPLVIYRWGPELTANGSYSTTGTKRVDNPVGWTNEALIDKIDDTNQTQTCGGASPTYKGFFACLVDDDDDGINEDAVDTNGDGVISFADDSNDKNGDGKLNTGDTLTDGTDTGNDITLVDSTLDKNKDGEINDEDGADTDGQTITAELFFTGETITVSGQNTDNSYSADTQTVARSRIAPENNSEDLNSYTMSFRTLDPSFACSQTDNWTMRTDFGESLTDPGSITNWNHVQNRQPQPIKISGDTLVISSVPTKPAGTNCNNSRINNGREATNPANPRDFSGNIGLGENDPWTSNNNVVAISQKIDFNDPTTFNGDKKGTCNSDHACTGSNGGKVNTTKPDNTQGVNPAVAMLKRGSVVPNYGGYDADANGVMDTGDQPSLGEFLHTQSPSLATKTPTGALDAKGNPVYEYRITNELKPDERIIGFEIGQTDTTKPGFDLQDNIFIVKSEAFSKEYDKMPNGDNYEPLS